VKINDFISNTKNIPVGCVQGSVLGPRLFSMYCRNLIKELGSDDVDIVTYADDSYVVVRGNSMDEIKLKAESTMKKHFKFLEAIGMVVNRSKTEVTYFNNKILPLELKVEGITIASTPKLKVLGLTFNHNLDWSEQVKTSVIKANTCIKRLSIIRKFMTAETLLRLMTTFYFSSVYYGATVWMNPELKEKHWKSLEMVHYRALRLAVGDYRRLRSRDTLNLECKRATPRQWASYITASTVIKILRSGSPLVIKNRLMKTICTNARKQHRPHFFDLSIKKIGRQALSNRIGYLKA